MTREHWHPKFDGDGIGDTIPNIGVAAVLRRAGALVRAPKARCVELSATFTSSRPARNQPTTVLTAMAADRRAIYAFKYYTNSITITLM